MAATLEVTLTVMAGAALSAFYYGGLWLTVKRLGQSDRPALLMLGSYMARMALCLPAFYLAVRGGSWERLLVFTAAFLATRAVLVHRLRPRRQTAGLP